MHAGLFRDLLRMALTDLKVRPLRTLLTIASFVSSIAIAAVLLAAGGGLRGAVREILHGLGEGHIVVIPGRTTGLGGIRRSGRPVRLRYEDIQGIAPSLPSFEGMAAYFDLRGGGASSWRYSIPWSPVRAVSHGYFQVRKLPLLEGRWFTAQEEDEEQWVAVLNEELRHILFPQANAVGQWIEWRGRRMTVVGVVGDQGIFPYTVIMPYQTVSHMADARYISGLVARPEPGADWKRATAEVRRVLAGLGGFSAADQNALEIEDNSEFTGRVNTITTALHLLVVTIAGVSLLLGGLGVANMMVIAISERTREIGLFKALGATTRIIFLQILCESLAIILAGGAIGMALGALACELVGELPMTAKYTAEVHFDWKTALLCLAGLAVVGVFSATIPARRAAALPYAETLRWE
ncbi:MAG: ABC transporter permease [Planctomycetes bacterium]|nr:ABC transporter permease [Planctomycetota bacterium]